MYEEGKGVEKHIHNALKYYKKATDCGNLEACCNLGRFYLTGINEVNLEIDKAKAMELLENIPLKTLEGAIQNNKQSAVYSLALTYHYGTADKKTHEKNVQKAVNIYEKLAEQNHAASILALASLSKHGTEIEKNMPKAINLYKKAANLGSGEAMYELACL